MKTLTVKEVSEQLDARIKDDRDSIKLSDQEIFNLRIALETLGDIKEDILVNIDNIFNEDKIK